MSKPTGKGETVKEKRNTTRIMVVKPSNPMYNYKNAELEHLILLKKSQM
jgi:hypothetical protein